MKTLGALLFAVVAAAAPLPACKSSSKDATFSQGAKRKVVRKSGTIDRSKAADVATTAAPANAVTRGSFTVWTEPKDPATGQNYQVFIEVKLPQSVATYEQSDLSGKVVGTDGYEQEFGSATASSGCGADIGTVGTTDEVSSEQNGFGLAAHPKDTLKLAGCDTGFEDFNFSPGRARLSVWVPGGDTKVRDTINVSSALLKETQAIAIEF